jgi:flagellar biosynthetic protein FliQ
VLASFIDAAITSRNLKICFLGVIMDVQQASELARTAILLSLLIGAPIMLTAVAIGLVISILQAVTQIQDQTLSMVPKIVAMFLVLIKIFPWMLSQMIEYSTTLISEIPGTI